MQPVTEIGLVITPISHSHRTCGLVLVGPFLLAIMSFVQSAQEAWSAQLDKAKNSFYFLFFLNYAWLGFSNVGLGFLTNEFNEGEK